MMLLVAGYEDGYCRFVLYGIIFTSARHYYVIRRYITPFFIRRPRHILPRTVRTFCRAIYGL